MIKKIKRFFKNLFSTKFIHPVVDERLSNAIDDKIARRKVDQENKINEHTKVLNNYLKTYFSKQYSDTSEMATAFETTNKQWIKHCRDVNGKEKLINLKKDAFKNRVQLTINQIKTNQENDNK